MREQPGMDSPSGGAAAKIVEIKYSQPGKKPLVGRLAKPGKDKAAVIEHGVKAVPKFNPGEFAKRLDVWWEDGSTTYFQRRPKAAAGESDWVKLTLRQLERELADAGVMGVGERGAPKGERLTEVDQVVLWITRNRMVEVAMSIAGYDAGVYVINGRRVLVRRSALFIKAREGDWPMIDAVLEGLLVRPLESGVRPLNFMGYVDSKLGRDRGRGLADRVWRCLVREEGGVWVLDQRVVFFSWLKCRLEAYTKFRKGGVALHRNGQMMVLAGPGDSGKGFVQHFILKPLLGGREGDPTKYLSGKTNFNGDLVDAECQLMEEMVVATDMKSRLAFGEQVKAVVTKPGVRMEAKGKDALMIDPVWTWVLSLNDDPDRMRAFPPLANDLADKVILLHAKSSPMPVDTTTPENYAKLVGLVTGELPGFLHWLMESFVVPEVLLDGRFGMRAVHAPELVQGLFDDTPAGSLLELIDASTFGASDLVTNFWDTFPGENRCGWIRNNMVEFKEAKDAEILERCWCGKGAELQTLLCKDENPHARSARNLFDRNKINRLLGRLNEDAPHRVRSGRLNSERFWVVVSAGV